MRVNFAEFARPVEIDLKHFREVFPKATFHLYTDQEKVPEGFDEIVYPEVNREAKRWPWRANDLWKAKALLRGEGSEISLAFDADVHVINREAIQAILPLTDAFGLCLPANPRMLVRTDSIIGTDGSPVLDETNGWGMAYNCAIMSFKPSHKRAHSLVEEFVHLMETDPARGPLVWWRAALATRFAPYALPRQWCVCDADCGIGNEVLLHIGHERVKVHYGV